MANRLRNTILFYIILIATVLGIGYVLYTKLSFPGKTVIQDSTIVMERINKVMKLVTVEGQFSEIIKHEESYWYNISPLRKKVLIHVKAKVLAGYDLEKIDLELDELSHTVYIRSWPEAEILSIEDDLSYYDISEGMFNGFDKSDYNELQAMAKKKIAQAAIESGLLNSAEEQKKEVFSLIELITEGTGWKLKIESSDHSILD